MKILIGYDGSDCAEKALTDLRSAGLPVRAEATVLSAVDVFIPSEKVAGDEEEVFPITVRQGVKLARKRAQHALEEARILAARAAEIVGEMFPDWKVSAEAQADTPHWAIITKAEEWKPDLVVVGSHGRSALGRAILGSVSQKVLYETQSSVRIARGRDFPPDKPIRLVLGTDGSSDAKEMLKVVASRNWPPDTQVKLITAIETFHEDDSEFDLQMRSIRDMQSIAGKKLTKAGLDVIPIITEEDPKHFIVRKAEQWEADCIFLGAIGHRFFERFFLGSVSSSVAAHAHCSVEVVRKKHI
jgi:nucleotide-binding universal stress UspA family protein